MIVALYGLGFVLYCACAWLTYESKSPWLPVLGAVLGAATTALWFSIVRLTDDASTTYTRALIWDTMIVVTYSLFPLLFAPIALTRVQFIGYFVTLCGIAMIR